MHHDSQRIGRGWAVFDSRDEKVGDVADIGSSWLLVQKGLIFVKDLYIPLEAVKEVDEANQAAYLDVAKDEMDALGWDQPPSEADRIDAVTTTGDTLRGSATADPSLATDDAARVRLHEEDLQARTRREQTGEVGVRKRVVEQEQELEVPVQHDELEVRRVRVDREASPSDAAFTDDGDTIRVPMTAETVEVDKQARVVEEIEIRKRPVTERQRVRDTVRREEVEVDREGDVRLVDDAAGVDADRAGDLVGAGSDRFQRTSIDDIAADVDDQEVGGSDTRR